MNRARKRSLVVSCLIITPFLALWLVRAHSEPFELMRSGHSGRAIDPAPSLTVTPTSFPGPP